MQRDARLPESARVPVEHVQRVHDGRGLRARSLVPRRALLLSVHVYRRLRRAGRARLPRSHRHALLPERRLLRRRHRPLPDRRDLRCVWSGERRLPERDVRRRSSLHVRDARRLSRGARLHRRSLRRVHGRHRLRVRSLLRCRRVPRALRRRGGLPGRTLRCIDRSLRVVRERRRLQRRTALLRGRLRGPMQRDARRRLRAVRHVQRDDAMRRLR